MTLSYTHTTGTHRIVRFGASRIGCVYRLLWREREAGLLEHMQYWDLRGSVDRFAESFELVLELVP